MKRIYKGQSKLRILIDTACDLSGFEEINVKALKPDNTIKIFSAVIKDIEKGIIFFDLQDENDIDASGWWTLWPEIRFDDDRCCFGRATRFFVHEPGSL